MPRKIVGPAEGEPDIKEMRVHTWLLSQIKKRYPKATVREISRKNGTHVEVTDGSAWSYKPPSGAYGKKGTPDFLFCINGCFIAIEVKRISGSMTKMQDIELQKISDAGGLAILLVGKNFEVFKHIDEFVNRA